MPLAGDAGAGTVGGDLMAAAAASVASHPVEVGGVVAFGLIAVAVGRIAIDAGRRRRRGRWGLLQDRFSSLADRCDDRESDREAAVPTNPARGALIRSSLDDRDDPEIDRALTLVVDALDRAAFDPSWSDAGTAADDDDYRRAATALESLERRCAAPSNQRGNRRENSELTCS